MNTEYFNLYFNYFTTSFSRKLKPGWGIKMTVYPFTRGAVVVISMKKGVANSLEKKKESINLGGALTMTSLFPAEKIAPLADKTIGETSVGIDSITKYVLFKNDKNCSWGEVAAQNDVEKIMEKTRAKYGK